MGGLPEVPNINYDFEADPNIFDEASQDNVNFDDEDHNYDSYTNTQEASESSPSPLPSPMHKWKHNISPHKQQIHELETQNDRIKSIVSQMRNEMKFQEHPRNQNKEKITPTPPLKFEDGNEITNNNNLENLQGEVQRLSQKIGILTKENKIHDKPQKHTQELEKTLEKCQDDLLMAQNEIQDYETQVSSYKAELASYKFTVKQKQITLQQLHRQLAVVQRQNDSYYEDLHLAKETIKILESQLSQLQSEVSYLKSDYNKQFAATLQHKSDKVDQKVIAENKFLRMKMEEATKDIKRLMHEKEKLIDISNMLRADIVQVNDKMSEESPLPIVEHYEDRIAELEVLVRKLNLHNKVLKKELTDYLQADKLKPENHLYITSDTTKQPPANPNQLNPASMYHSIPFNPPAPLANQGRSNATRSRAPDSSSRPMADPSRYDPRHDPHHGPHHDPSPAPAPARSKESTPRRAQLHASSSQRALEAKAKLLEQRNAITQAIKKNNK